MKAFAAVDLGASSGRVVVGRLEDGPDGPVVGLEEVARFPNSPVLVPAGDGATLHWDVLALYRGVLDGLREAVRAHGRLDGVGIDAWAVDHGLLDADGALLGNPVHYRDSRTNGVPERVFATVPAQELYARTGVQVQPFNTVFQLVAAAGTHQLSCARRLLLVPDLLVHWLTGVQGAEVTNASTTGLLGTDRRWDVDLAERLGIDPALLPGLVEPGTVVGPVRAGLARGLGQDEPLPVVAVASHDTASAVVGVPMQDPGAAYISCGTWSLVGLELPAPVLTEQSRAANFTNELGLDGTVRYLRNVMGLWVLQESLRTWDAAGSPSHLADLLAEAAAVPGLTRVVDVDDPVLLSPGDVPARIAGLLERSGQPAPSSRAELVRCIIDSLALAHRRALRDAAELSGREVTAVHVVGGGAYNELLCLLTADATGLPVLAGPVEAAALGNVLVQARAVGAIEGDLATLRAVGARSSHVRTYEPPLGSAVPGEGWDEAERRVGAT